MIYLELFWSFFQIGLFSIGGGYAAMPLIEQQTVILHNWLTPAGFADIVTIAEMTPGPIALNAATFVGTQVAGLPGAIIATLGCVIPSSTIVLLLAYIYYKFKSLKWVTAILNGVRPAVIALIGSAGITLFCMALYESRTVPSNWLSLDVIALVIIITAFIILRVFRLKPLPVMFGFGFLFFIIKLIVQVFNK